MKTPRIRRPEKGTKSTRPTRPPPRKPPTPKPSARFQREQQKLHDLIDSRQPRREVEESLRDEFKAAFGLTKDVYRRAKRHFQRLAGYPYPPPFDHVSYYQRGSNLFIVSQPYGVDAKELRRWCHQAGAVAHGVIGEWAHYYPGHATCLYVEFAPPTPKQRPARRPR